MIGDNEYIVITEHLRTVAVKPLRRVTTFLAEEEVYSATHKRMAIRKRIISQPSHARADARPPCSPRRAA
jgi:hypothetical protein